MRNLSLMRPAPQAQQRVRALAAIFFGAILACTMTPVAAFAAGHSCSSGDVCVYEDDSWQASDPWLSATYWPTHPWSAFNGNYANMNNGLWPHTYNNPDTCNNAYAYYAPCNLNDTITSAKNRDGSYKVRLFVHSNWSGSYQTISPLYYVSKLRSGIDNEVSSLCWIGGSINTPTCQN